MAFQHYIPATFLANFSSDTFEERRKRQVSVGDKKNGSIFTAPVSTIMGSKNIYSEIIDESFTFYEAKLNLAITQLINGTLTCELWANTLIDFVAGLLIRGPDFNDRFERRISSFRLADLNSKENTNYSRMIERQRLRASIIGSKWTILRVDGDINLITNDLGFTPYQNLLLAEIGLAIPINTNNVLLITPRMRGKIAIAIGGVWVPIINYSTINKDLVIELNKSIDVNSQRFIIGENTGDISKYLTIRTSPHYVPEPFEMGFMSGHMAMIFEHMWIKLLSVISRPPKRDGDFLFVDFEKNAKEFYKTQGLEPPNTR